MSFIESLPARGAPANSNSNIGVFKPKGRPRGRPKGWRKPITGEPRLYTTIKIDTWFKDELDREHRPKEIIADTLTRMYKERSDKIQLLTQKLDRANEENDRLKGLLQVQEIKQN